jgi:uncharacterized cupredoxin-like copper-binding protein
VKRTRVATAILAVLGLAACTSQPGTSAPAATTPAAGGTTVDVKLQEWSVNPSTASVPAGKVTFKVQNTGPEDTHEFVVLKTDLDPGALPTDETGAVSETGAGITVVDEIEDIAVGASQDLEVSLEAGKYVLLCNIYSEDEKEAHYKMGMRTAFQVTAP